MLAGYVLGNSTYIRKWRSKNVNNSVIDVHVTFFQRYNRLYNKQNDILMVLLKMQIFLREYFLTIKDVVEFL